MGELESLSGSLGHSVAMRDLREGVWDGTEWPEHRGQDGKGQRTGRYNQRGLPEPEGIIPRAHPGKMGLMCCSEKGRAATDGAGKMEGVSWLQVTCDEMSDTINSSDRSAGAKLE